MANKEHLTILEQGAEVWNQWREKNPGITPNLSGAKLQGKKLAGTNFTGADIRGTDFFGADLTDADFTRAKGGLGRWRIILVYILSFLSSIVSLFLNFFLSVFICGAVLMLLEEMNITALLQTSFIAILFILLLLLILGRAVRQEEFFNMTGALAEVLAENLAMALAMAMALFVYMAGAWDMDRYVAGFLAVVVIILSFHIGWPILQKEEQFAGLRRFRFNRWHKLSGSCSVQSEFFPIASEECSL